MRQPDPDATVILPIVRAGDQAGRPDPDATVLLPVVPDPAGPTEEEPAQSIGRSSAGMALGSLFSRGTGFLRTIVIAGALGSAVGDAYTNATMFPGMIYELLLGGVLSSVLVPLLVRARESDDDRGEAYTQRLLSASVLFLAAATVLATVCAPLLSLIGSRDNYHLTTVWAFFILPTIFFYGLAALFAAVLNTRGSFAAPTWAPILNNLMICLVGAAVILLPKPGGSLTLANVPTSTILLFGLGTTAGIVIQSLALIPALRRVGFRWRWRLDVRALRLREIGRLGAWMLCYVGVSQVAVLAITKLANLARQNGGTAGILVYNNVFLLMMMAHGIIAVSILTALMPRLAASAAAGRLRDLAADLSRGTRLVIVLLVPVSALYYAFSAPIGHALFVQGEFTAADAEGMAPVTLASAFALVPFAVSQLQTFAFYALPDTRTPALINIPVVGIRIGVDVALYLLLGPSLVAAGLMYGNAVSFLAAALLSGWLLRRRIGSLGMRRILVTLGRSLAAALAGLLVAGGMDLLLTEVAGLGTGKLESLVRLVVGGTLIFGVYGVVGYLLGIPELREALGMVRRRLGR